MSVIYLHGFASGPGSRKARFFRDRLAEYSIEALVPDLAQGDFENLTVTGQLKVLEELVRDTPVTLIGSSMGGYVAALFAGRNPQRVDKMVLLAPAFGFADRWPAVVGEESMRRWLSEGRLPVFHYADGCMRNLGLRMYEDSRSWEAEPDFQQPAMIFHGVKDSVVPIDASRQFASRHPNAKLIEMQSDHELTDMLPDIWETCKAFLLK